MAKNATDIAAKWAQRIGASVDAVRQGVNGVTTSPTSLAAKAADLWQQRLTMAETKAKYIRGLNRVSLDDWKNMMLTKGVNRIASGASAAQPKFEAFMSDFLPFVLSVAAKVHAMPKVTLEDRINRMVAQVRGNAAYSRR